MATVSIDPNIYITPSKALIGHLVSNKDKLDNPPKRIRKILTSDLLLDDVKLTVDDVKWIVSSLPDTPASMLMSSDLVLPSPEFAERNPELEARCQKLRAEQENRQYDAMTGNVRRDGPAIGLANEEESFKKQFQEVNSFLMLIVQFIVSVACSFMFGFFGPFYLYGKTELGPRLLFGIICGAVVGCADMYFVIRQMLKEDGIDIAKKID